MRAAFDAGASGYLTKSAAPDEIETAVREILKGRFYLSPVVTQSFMGLTKNDIVEPQGTPRPAAGEALFATQSSEVMI